MIARILLVCCLVFSANASAEEETPLDLETILNETLGVDDYVDTEKCLSLHKLDRVQAISEQHVVFSLRGNKHYLATLVKNCPGIERNARLMYETRGGRICSKDTIRGMMGMGFSERPGPPCQIPGFQEISKEQLALLKDALINRRMKTK